MARLPTPGGDAGNWGSILNDFLNQSHTSGGGLKTAAISSAGAELTSNKGVAGGYAPLDGSSRVPLANLPPTSVPDADATTKGILQLSGDLAGTASSPAIASGAVDNSKIAAGANIAQSKINNLSADLAAKANDADVVHDTGNETIAGTKTFSSAPVVPDDSFAQSKVTNLTSDLSAINTTLSGKADTADVLLQANDLSDLNDAATARSNLGLGSASLSDVGDFEASGSLSAHAADTTSVHGIADTSALETTTGAQAKVDAHVNDASDAHDASAISFSPAGTIAATDVQAAIEEVAAEATGATNLAWNAGTSTVSSDTGTDATLSVVDATNPGLMTVADKTKLDAIEAGATADQSASEVSVTDAGSYFTSANVEGALQELGAGLGGGAELTYPSFDETTVNIPNGTTYTNSFDWTGVSGSVPVKHFRLEPSAPGMIFDFKILRQNDFSAGGLDENIAFWVKSVQGNFQREFLWEYEDEDATEKLHVWISNTSAVSGTVRILLNSRVIQ